MLAPTDLDKEVGKVDRCSKINDSIVLFLSSSSSKKVLYRQGDGWIESHYREYRQVSIPPPFFKRKNAI